jgi:6-phosphogluconolactonase/glucosamine-6-phosphate isomerase/deaminase
MDDLPAALEKELVIITRHPVTRQVRIGLTLSVVAQARNTMLVLQGEEKVKILQKLLRKEKAIYPIEFAIFAAKSAVIATDIHE